jgi:hypothetical protein
MRSIIIGSLLLFVCLTVNAQDVFLNLEGGFNSSKFNYGPKPILSTSALNRYYAGVSLDIRSSHLSIQPGILFSTNGGNNTSAIELNGQEGISTHRIMLRYLFFSVNAVYRPQIAARKVFIGGGPYFGYGLEGKDFGDNRVGDKSVNHYDSDVYFGYLPENIRNHDFGFNLLTGYEFERMSVKAQYTFGIRNLSNISIPPYSKNRILSLGLSYRLARIVLL